MATDVGGNLETFYQARIKMVLLQWGLIKNKQLSEADGVNEVRQDGAGLWRQDSCL